MSPEQFDEVDLALASGLSALAPDVREGTKTLAAMRPRFERARTRARIARIGGAVGALVVIGSLAALMAPHSARTRVSVSSQTSTPGTTARPQSTTTTVGGSRGGFATTTVSTPTTAGSKVAPTTAVTVIVPVTTPGGGGGPSTPSTTTTVSVGDDHEYSSTSGSISVRFVNGTLTLLRVSPGNGFAEDVRDRGPDRVEVRFTSGGRETARIEIRVENGQLVRIDHSDG